MELIDALPTIIIAVIGTGGTIWVSRQSKKAQRVATEATTALESKKLDYNVFKDAQDANQKYLDRLERDLEKTKAELANSHVENHELREEIRALETEIDEYREKLRGLQDEVTRLKRKLREQGIEVE